MPKKKWFYPTFSLAYWNFKCHWNLLWHIEKEIFKFVCELGVSITQEFLKGYDKQLMEERDKKEYRHKGYRPDHIRCIYGAVPYERVILPLFSGLLYFSTAPFILRRNICMSEKVSTQS